MMAPGSLFGRGEEVLVVEMWPDRLRFRKASLPCGHSVPRRPFTHGGGGTREGASRGSAASAGDKPYFDCQRLPQEIGRRLCEQLAGVGPLAPLVP